MPLASLGETVQRRRDEIVNAARKHGAIRIQLIGSVARGEETPESDIDFLVTWADDTSLLDHAALMLELEELLGRKVDLASDGWVKPRIRESVYRDAIPL